MSAEKIRVGILGQGRSGYDIHARWLREDPKKYTIVAVADLLPERRKEAREELGAKTYADYKALLKDRSLGLDLIVNALPSFLHPKGSIDALKAGYNVVSEKPAARTVKDFDRVVKASKENGKLLLPFQNSRFNPLFMKAKSLLDSGILGEAIHIRLNWSGFARRWDWQCIQEYWGGNLLNTGPHPVDMAVAFLGKAMPKVTCHMRSVNPFGDAENFCALYLQAPKLPLVEVVLNSFQAFAQGEQMNISCTYGGIAGGGNTLKWRYFDPQKAPKHKFSGTWSDKRQYCGEQLDWIEDEFRVEEDGDQMFQTMSKGFYDNVYDIIRNKAKRIITLDQVRRQVAIMEESHRQNRMPRLKRTFLK